MVQQQQIYQKMAEVLKDLKVVNDLGEKCIKDKVVRESCAKNCL